MANTSATRGPHEGQSTKLNGKMRKRVATSSWMRTNFALMNKFITCSRNMSNVYLLLTVYRIPNIGNSSRKSKPNDFNLKLLSYLKILRYRFFSSPIHLTAAAFLLIKSKLTFFIFIFIFILALKLCCEWKIQNHHSGRSTFRRNIWFSGFQCLCYLRPTILNMNIELKHVYISTM